MGPIMGSSRRGCRILLGREDRITQHRSRPDHLMCEGSCMKGDKINGLGYEPGF